MRFGETNEQRWRRLAREQREEIERLTTPRIKFAYFPVKLKDGSFVWLENYLQKEEYYPSKIWGHGFYTNDNQRIDQTFLHD